MEQDNRLNLLCVTGVKSSVLQQAAGGSRPSSRLPKVSSLLQLRMTPMSLGWGWGALVLVWSWGLRLLRWVFAFALNVSVILTAFQPGSCSSLSVLEKKVALMLSESVIGLRISPACLWLKQAVLVTFRGQHTHRQACSLQGLAQGTWTFHYPLRKEWGLLARGWS